MSNLTPDPQAPRDDDATAWDAPDPGPDYGTTAYDATGRGPSSWAAPAAAPSTEAPTFGLPDPARSGYPQPQPWDPPDETASWNRAWDAPPSPSNPWTAPPPGTAPQPFPGAAQYAPEPWATGGYPVGFGAPSEHPQATTVLILGILSLFIGVTGPFAWFLGSQARREMAANPGRWAPSGSLTVGWVLGVVTTLLGVLAVGFFLLMIVGLAAFSI